MGLAAAAEHREIQAHLDRGCVTCTAAMRRARDAAAVLGIAARGAEPAPLLRRITPATGRASAGFIWIPILGGALAFAIIACFYFAGRENDTGRELGRVNEIRRTQNMEITRLHDALGIIGGGDTRSAAFGARQQTAPTGRVFVSPSQGAVLIVSNLPPASPGKAYAMWTIPKDGKPRPAGLFQAASGGATVHMRRGSIDPDAEAVEVTLEDAAGVAAPATSPLFTVRVQTIVR
ncbi:MAG: anti-sigma factor [Acidobacteria bacterium]|nr:anti-sigma factor [Acidobacteriota bacterium]